MNYSTILSPPGSKLGLLSHMSNYFQSRLPPCQEQQVDNQCEESESPKKPSTTIIQYIQHHSLKPKPVRTLRSQQRSGFNTIWKIGALRIIYLISRFLQMVKTSTARYKFRLVNRKIMRIISDPTTDYQYYQLNELIHDRPGRLQLRAIKLWIQIVPNFDFSLPIFRPDDRLKIVFDTLVLIVITVNLFYIPLRLSFSISGLFETTQVQFVFDQMPSIVFIVDIAIKFLTAYFEGGVIHENFKDIAKHYIRGELFSDILVVIPFILQSYETRYLDFLLLLRVFKVAKIVENIEESSSVRENYAVPLDLAKLVFILIFVSHMCACVWNFIGDFEVRRSHSLKLAQGISDAWLTRYHMEDSSWQSRYITSFYWSTITTLTVGYGDLVPGNDIERLTCSFLVLVCSIVFGYTISRIGSIFAQISEKNQKFRDTMAQINSYIKKRKLNKQLQTKVKKYLEYLFMSEQYKNEECETLMDKLSQDLKREVKIDMYLPILKSNPMLANNFKEPVLKLICICMHTRQYTPGELIFRQGDVLKQLNFIVSGNAQAFVQLEQKQTPLRSYNKGFVLGIKQFLTQLPIQYCCRAQQFVEIAYINFDEFRICLQDFPDALQTYQLIKDNIIYNIHYKGVSDVCQICQSSHSLKNCPFVFYQANRNKLIKDNKEQNQRLQFNRTKMKWKGALESLKAWQNDAMVLIEEKGLINADEFNKDFEKKLGLQVMPSQDVITQTIKSPKDSSQKAQDQPSLKVLRTHSKKRTFQEENLKFSRRYSPPVKEEMQQFEFLDRSESTMIVNMLKNIQVEYKEIIKDDPLPLLDKFCNFSIYYKAQNLSGYLSKINSTVKHKKPPRYKKQKEAAMMRQQGSFMREMRGSQLLNQMSSRRGDTPNAAQDLFKRHLTDEVIR